VAHGASPARRITRDPGTEREGGPFSSTQAFLDAITPGQTLVKVRWRPVPSSTSAPVDQAEIEQ